MSVKVEEKNVHEIHEATSPGASESVPDHSQSSCDHVFGGGPISATRLTSSVLVVSCEEKAILEVCLALNPKENKHVPCAI